MAIVEVKLKTESKDLADGVWTGVRIFSVETDSLDDTVDDVKDADDGTTAIPDIGDAWAGGSSLKARGYAIRHDYDEHPLFYEVTVNYSSKDDGSSTIENPLSRPTQYSYEDSQAQEPYFRDTDDNPVVNSAGDDFTDLPARDSAEGVIVITRNVASFNDLTAEGYRNKINSANKTINSVTYATGTLRIVGWSASGPNEENGVTFWTETIRIAKRAAGWDHVFEDRGLNQLDDDDKRIPILDANNVQVTVPYPLNGSGAAQATPATAPAVITFKPYEATSFPSL